MESKKASTAEEKYWEGLSTPEEERTLFGDPQEEDKSYFELINEFRDLRLDSTFDSRLLSKINQEIAPEPKVTRMRWWRYAAAAVVILAVGGSVWKQAYLEQDGLLPAERIEMEKAKQALLLMSEKLNEGMEFTYSLGSLDNAINTITEEN